MKKNDELLKTLEKEKQKTADLEAKTKALLQKELPESVLSKLQAVIGSMQTSNDLNAQQLNFNPVEKGHNFDNHQNAETNSLDNSTMIIGNHVNQLSTQLLLELVGIIKQLLPANLQSKAST